eukprot:4613514-Prymnesium_polylepis.1
MCIRDRPHVISAPVASLARTSAILSSRNPCVLWDVAQLLPPLGRRATLASFGSACQIKSCRSSIVSGAPLL